MTDAPVPDDHPDWQVAIIDGRPEIVINKAAVESLIKRCPYGEKEARRRLRAAGYPKEIVG